MCSLIIRVQVQCSAISPVTTIILNRHRSSSRLSRPAKLVINSVRRLRNVYSKHDCPEGQWYPEGSAGGWDYYSGDLVELTSDGKVQRKASAATTAQRAFAVENEVVGKGIDHDYAAGDNVLYEVLPPGAEVYALVPASAAAIVIGDRLESA